MKENEGEGAHQIQMFVGLEGESAHHFCSGVAKFVSCPGVGKFVDGDGREEGDDDEDDFCEKGARGEAGEN